MKLCGMDYDLLRAGDENLKERSFESHILI